MFPPLYNEGTPFKSADAVRGCAIKLSEKIKPAFRALRSLLVDIPLPGLDNRILAPLLGVRLLPRLLRPPMPDLRGERLDGAAQDCGLFVRAPGVFVNFDSSAERRDFETSENSERFFQTFLKTCRRRETSPSQMRILAEKDVPAGAEIHSDPTFFIYRLDFVNPTLLLNQIAVLLDVAALLQTPPGKITLRLSGWVGKTPPENPLEEPLRKIFNVRLTSELQGAHWFQNLVCFPPQTVWRRILPYRSAALRQRLLTAFGIPVRKRCEALRKIMLISRHDYPVHWGLNVLTRKISNEEEIAEALRRHFPGVEVQRVRLEELPVSEQLRQTHESDLLISMHGAALGFSALLPENAAMLELFPAHLRMPHYFKTFYNMSACNNLHYRRWFNLNPRREYCSEVWAQRLARNPERLRMEPRRDFTRVPPAAMVRRIRALQRCIERGARRPKTP